MQRENPQGTSYWGRSPAINQTRDIPAEQRPAQQIGDRECRRKRASYVRLWHRPSATLLAEGPVGWGVTPFDDAFYVRRRYLKTDRLRPNFIPGLCFYKFLYVWLDLHTPANGRARSIGWLYWLPNPLLPFIWFRVALPRSHPDIRVERYEA